MEKALKFKHAKSAELQWTTITAMFVFHVFAIWALFEFSWSNLIAGFVLWWIAASWGIGLGYHRLLTHGGFKAPKLLVHFLAFCGTLALQAGPISWVATHRMHHKFTETEDDPHSPRGGTIWAHIGWILQGVAQVKSKTQLQRYAPDLMKDKVLRVMNSYYWMTPIIVGGILFAIGGWSMVLWGIFLRNVCDWHFTWLVNSATHMWGTRRFETNDDSRNNGLIAAITFGEGWHNNHHAHPRSAKHGLTWYEFDINWMQIQIMRKLGLIKKVYAYKLKEGEEEEIMSEPLSEVA